MSSTKVLDPHMSAQVASIGCALPQIEDLHVDLLVLLALALGILGGLLQALKELGLL